MESENGGGGVMVVMGGGYKKERPPEDDCCPICFDDFNLPCKTSCGHWFCCSCILRLWRYTTYLQRCKCPFCGRMITNLAPLISLPNQRGEDVRKVLQDVDQYNHLNGGRFRWYGLFRKVLLVPHITRRWLREFNDERIYGLIFRVMRMIGLLLGIIYQYFGFRFFPHGGHGIVLTFEICGLALMLLLALDRAWYRWRLRWNLAGLQRMG